MEPFFETFQGFKYNPQESPERNFRRLESGQGWLDSQYLIFRRQFFVILIETTNSPVHRFFVTQHPDFLTYDSDVSPRSEFERLRIFKNWIGEEDRYEGSKTLFEDAFREEFSGALDNYFSEFTDFPYNPRCPPMVEFKRLMKYKKWGPKSAEHKEARSEFFEEFTEDFGTYFGTNEGDITTWQHLCQVLRVEPIPPTITQCRKILQPLNVNIHDLVHHMRTGAPFEFFPNVGELRKHTKKKGLIFPKRSAKGGPLRFLLREILGPRRRGN